MITKPSIPVRPCVATIGFFDGVHRGHRYLIEQVRAIANEHGLASAVITFPVHPRKVIQQDFRPALLTTCQEKSTLLLSTGIDYCFMLPFTTEVAQLSARRFMQMLQQHYNVKVLVIGYDHRFGHNRCEGFGEYLRYGQEMGMDVCRAKEYDMASSTVSSSTIRRLLSEGKVEEAARLLSYDYSLQGTVTGGHQIGRTIGFPTANLCTSDEDKLIPANGVYAVKVTVDNATYGGMLSIGHRPTLNNGSDRSIEVHIFDFNRDIYNTSLRLHFVAHLRHERKFASIEALKAQLAIDEANARKRTMRTK